MHGETDIQPAPAGDTGRKKVSLLAHCPHLAIVLLMFAILFQCSCYDQLQISGRDYDVLTGAVIKYMKKLEHESLQMNGVYYGSRLQDIVDGVILESFNDDIIKKSSKTLNKSPSQRSPARSGLKAKAAVLDDISSIDYDLVKQHRNILIKIVKRMVQKDGMLTEVDSSGAPSGWSSSSDIDALAIEINRRIHELGRGSRKSTKAGDKLLKVATDMRG